MSEQHIVSVSELNEYIKLLLDSAPLLNQIYVKGEISNFTNHYKTGHFYFTLKDEGGVLRSVMFRSSASKLNFLPENGMKVICGGRVSAFPRDGQYQLYVNSMEPDGIGALYIAYEQLKKRLEQEGLFSEEHKKELPKIPTKVGVITSSTGAAIKDIIQVMNRRFPFAKIILYPSLVQGVEAPKQLIAGLDYFESHKNVNVIIIGRGGGSLEELWAFNDEALARRIYACKIPIISAVGHERDYTICDFVADKRAPTPSAAAEIAVPETLELKRKINNITGRITTLLLHQLQIYRTQADQLKNNRVLLSPKNLVDDKRMLIVSFYQRLMAAEQLFLEQKHRSFAASTAKLDALNPMAVISRGYGVAFDEDGNIIKSVNEIQPQDRLRLQLNDGDIFTRVEVIKQKKRGRKNGKKAQ